MQVVLQGSLRHFPAAELLSFLCGRGQSGTLDGETPNGRVRIIFAGDRIVWAESSRAADPTEVVLDLFATPNGTFTLLDSAVVPANVTPVALDVAALVEEWRRRANAAGVYSDATLFRVVDDPLLQQQVSLTGDQFKLLFKLSTGRTFKELRADLGAPTEEVAERLKQLVAIGLVTVVAAPPAEEKTDPDLKKTTAGRRRTLVGSLTPDDAPDNVYPLLDSAYTLGRAPSNTITIPDASVSSNHAQILRTAEGFVIEDLQSRNGTFVNGEKVDAKRLLADGDLIRLGKIIMTFNVAREGKSGETTLPEVRLG
jgi:hypothetical protein